MHCVWTLKKHGCEAILVNNNPETVSTDFDTGDRLYFDPLNPESVDNIIATEKPDACVVQFGGQTAIKLAKHMDEIGLPILGTPADAIDEAEDRERFDELLERCSIPRAPGRTVFQSGRGSGCADEIGLPVLMRPSYVLGGQNMIVAYTRRTSSSTWALSPSMWTWITLCCWISTSWAPSARWTPSATAKTT